VDGPYETTDPKRGASWGLRDGWHRAPPACDEYSARDVVRFLSKSIASWSVASSSGVCRLPLASRERFGVFAVFVARLAGFFAGLLSATRSRRLDHAAGANYERM